jgi:hypothetical protein
MMHLHLSSEKSIFRVNMSDILNQAPAAFNRIADNVGLLSSGPTQRRYGCTGSEP